MQRIVLIFFLLASTLDGYSQSWNWARTSGGVGNSVGISCAVDSQNNLYAAGVTYGTVSLGSYLIPTNSIYVAKYDVMGNVLWVTYSLVSATNPFGIVTDHFGNEYLFAMTDMSSVTFGGHTIASPVPPGWCWYFVVKINSSGAVKWMKSLGNTAAYIPSIGNMISLDNRGNIVLTCSFCNDPTIGGYTLAHASADSTNDLLVTKLDTAGNAIWVRSFGGRQADEARGICVTNGGNIYISGSFKSELRFGSSMLRDTIGTWNFYLAKLDSAGHPVWARQGSGHAAFDNTSELTCDDSENVFLGGLYGYPAAFFSTASIGAIPLPPAPVSYGFLAKYSPTGAALWAKAMKGPRIVTPSAIKTDRCNNIWMFAGMTDDSSTVDTIDNHTAVCPNNMYSEACLLAGWTNTGSLILTTALNAGFLDDYNVYDMAIDKQNNLYVTATNEDSDSLIIGHDTLLLGSGRMFIAKLNPDTVVAPPGIAITASPGDTVCPGTPVTFTATVSGSILPAYQWLVNGVLAGSGGGTLTYTPSDGDSIRCVLTNMNACSDPFLVGSNTIIITSVLWEEPAVAITASPGDTVCPGDSASFYATATLAGPSPVFQWKKNSINVGSGGASYTYIPAAGDSIRCILTSSLPCLTRPTVSSNAVVVFVGSCSLNTPEHMRNIVQLYPNPATDELTIQTRSTDLTSFTISNTFGQELISGRLNSTTTRIKVNSFPTGIYYVTLKGDNAVKTEKFMKW